MDNIFDLLPFIIAFIIAFIIFLMRLLSGNKKQNTPQEPTPNPQEKEINTLDDLLKQITQQMQQAKQADTKEQAKQDKSLQEQRLERQKIKAQKAAQQAQKIQENLNSLLVEKGITEEQRKKDQHFQPYKVQTATKNKFATLLRDRDYLKNALILNEILNPKHF